MEILLKNKSSEWSQTNYEYVIIGDITLGDIINKANLVRGIMYRTHYSQEYRKSSFERFEECFEEIFNNEQKRLEFMLEFNWKHNIKEIE